MMQIDFYILKENSHRDINQMVCRLCEKALQQSLTVLIYTESFEQAQRVDDLLWTFKADSFIAHKNLLYDFSSRHTELAEGHQGTQYDNETEQPTDFNFPVLISDAKKINEKQLTKYTQLIINLSNQTPTFYQQFSRMAEIIGKNPENKKIARDRYRFYRNLGYSLNKYDL